MKIRLALILLAMTVLLAPLPSGVVERLYSQNLYIRVQRVVTWMSNGVPFALLDLLLVAVAVAGALFLWRAWRHLRARRWRTAGMLCVTALSVAAVLYLWFLLTWGLNYRREPLQQRLRFRAAQVTPDSLLRLGARTVAEANATRRLIPSTPSNAEIPGSLAESFNHTQSLLGLPRTALPGRPKPTMLGFYLRAATVDGVTNPFFLEVMTNPDLLPFERPFVYAHEWAHLAGFAEESAASFVGWLTCVRADQTARYSAWLFLYTHVAAELTAENRRALAATLSPEVSADLRAISARLQEAQPAVQQVAWRTYDRYLKANRVESGVQNYNEVVSLVLGSEFHPDWVPVLR
jgi:hypothetical protein